MKFLPDIECFAVNGRFYQIKNAKYWLLLYYHDFGIAGKWQSTGESRKNKSPQKYSILEAINPKMKIEDKYEFILDYPELIGYNQWRQSLSPLEDLVEYDKSPQAAKGYEPVNITWSGNYWGGLVNANLDLLLLKGSALNHDYSWYSIGRTANYNGGVPGPNDIIVKKTRLWIRVNPITMYCTLVHSNQRIKVFVEIILFVILS